jgi:hypothetical protein
MIELHRNADDRYADELEEKFRDLVIAYRSITYPPDSESIRPLPHIQESGKIIAGEVQIEKYIIDLEKELLWQRSLSGDGCYIDPDSGEVC